MEQQVQSTEDKSAEKSAQLWATWKRGFFMVLFWVVLRITEFVIILVGLAQFVLKLSTGSVNPKILAFGDSLTTFTRQMVAFLTYQSEEMPFPFGKWPESTVVIDEEPAQQETSGSGAGGTEQAEPQQAEEETPKSREEEAPAKAKESDTQAREKDKQKASAESNAESDTGEDTPETPPPPQGKASATQTGVSPSP